MRYDLVREVDSPAEIGEIIRNIGRNGFSAIGSAVERPAAVINGQIKEITPVGKTGFLKSHNTYSITVTDNSVTITFDNNMGYAPIQHETEWFHHTTGRAKFVEIPVLKGVDTLADAAVKAIAEMV